MRPVQWFEPPGWTPLLISRVLQLLNAALHLVNLKDAANHGDVPPTRGHLKRGIGDEVAMAGRTWAQMLPYRRTRCR